MPDTRRLNAPYQLPTPPDCYWVVPGLLRAGEYPGDIAELEARSRLRRSLDAWVMCFLDLAEEDETLELAPACSSRRLARGT